MEPCKQQLKLYCLVAELPGSQDEVTIRHEECASWHPSYQGSIQQSSLGQAAAAVAAVSAGARAEGAAEDSWEQQSGSEYQMDAESDDGSSSSSSSSSMSDDWEAEGSEADEAYSPESGGVQRRGTRGGCRQVRRGNPAVAPSAAAAAAAGEQGAGSNQAGSLHAPYSNLLWCESVVGTQRKLQLSSQLCTDIAGISSSRSGMPVQVTVVVYAASWDVQQHIRRQLQLEMPAGQQQGQGGGATDSSHVKRFGPYAATLKPTGTHLYITQLQHEHEPQTHLQYLAGRPHTLLLQERVPGSSPPHFRMHMKPGAPSQLKNSYGLVISRAGEAPGLQVVPGSVTEVTNVCITRSRRGQDAGVRIPKALACSQLPANATFPLRVTLTVVGEGQWEVNLSQALSRGQARVKCCCSQALSTFAGRSISRMSLSQDRQLTITLAPAAPPPPTAPAAPALAPAAAAAATAAATAAAQGSGILRVQQAPHHTMAAAGREPATTAASAAPSNLAVPSTPTAAQAVAVCSQPQSVLPLKRRPSTNAEPGARSNQQQMKTGRTVAAVAAAAIGGVASAPAAAAAGASVQPAAARKKVKHAAQLAAAAVAGQGVEAAMDGRPMSAPPQPLLPAAAAAAAGPRPLPAFTAPIKQEASAGPTAQPAAGDSPGQATQQGPAGLAGTPVAGAGTPGPPPGAAAAAVAADPSPRPVNPVPMKVEAPEVMDLTADDDDGGTAAAAAPQEAAGRLPVGLRLVSASSLTAIEDELLKLMTEGLMPLLPPQQYVRMMRQLQQLFDGPVDVAVLQRKYKYVQAAVMGRQVAAVVKALQALFKAFGG